MITRKKACFLSASHLKLPVRELGRAVRDRCERPPSSPAERGSRGQWGTVGVAGGGRADGRAPTLAQVRWGGVAGAARAAGEALISDLARTPICTCPRAGLGALPVYMGFKCGAKCIRLLET